MLTLEETKERVLHLLDPDDILETLQITSEEILDRFEDKVLINLNKLQAHVLDEEDEEADEY